MLDKENRFNRVSCVCIIRTVGPTGVKKALQPTGQHIIIHRLNKSKRRRERLAQRFPTVSKGSQRLSKPFEKGNVALELRLRAVAFYRCTPVSLLWPGSEQLWCTLSAVLHHFFILTHSFLFSFFFFSSIFQRIAMLTHSIALPVDIDFTSSSDCTDSMEFQSVPHFKIKPIVEQIQCSLHQ